MDFGRRLCRCIRRINWRLFRGQFCQRFAQPVARKVEDFGLVDLLFLIWDRLSRFRINVVHVEVKRIVIRQVIFFKTTVGEVAADRADNGTDRNGDDHAKDTPEAAADQNRDDDKEAGHAGRLAEDFRS